MKKFLLILLILGCAVPCFAKKRIEETIITPVTQLEKRQFQTRTYNAGDKVAVMKAILNTLQDEGYIVNNVNSLLGFIYGVKDFDTTDRNIDISKEFGFTKSRLNYNGVKVATLEFVANVTEYGDSVRVRVNFKRKLLNQYGNAQFIDDVDDSEFYDEFYKKAENNLNLQKQIKKEIPTVNNAPLINDAVPASLQTTEQKPQVTKETEPETKSETRPVEKVKTEGVKTEEIKSEKSSKAAKEKSITDDTKVENEEPISKKEYKKQQKQQNKMLKELEKEEKIRQKLLKEQEKQLEREQAKVIKQLNKAEKN